MGRLNVMCESSAGLFIELLGAAEWMFDDGLGDSGVSGWVGRVCVELLKGGATA